MNTAPSYMQKRCSDCNRIRCQEGCNCDCHWEPWRDMDTQLEHKLKEGQYDII